jgi:hypothetical protein
LLNDQFFFAFNRDTNDDLSYLPTIEANASANSQIDEFVFCPSLVESQFASLDKRKPAGIDGIHPHVLVESRASLSLPFSMIFTKSFMSAEVPSLWKQANITPIFKKGAKTLASNYRPISLTSVACKVMERIVRDEMFKYLLQNNLLSPSQHGFVYRKSTATNLLETIDLISDAMESHLELILILLDFAKAFDKVCHRRLLIKLKAMGFDERTCNWVKAFLSNRKQRVVQGKHASRWCDVLSGVPQGSVLGPLLFLIFINDMPGLTHHICKLFADDSKLLATIRNPNDLDLVQDEINALVAWSQTWNMCKSSQQWFD